MSDDMFYCSFVSIHYIICECGETFPTEEELKGHLEKDHSLKKEKKEYKCGVVSTKWCCLFIVCEGIWLENRFSGWLGLRGIEC